MFKTLLHFTYSVPYVCKTPEGIVKRKSSEVFIFRKIGYQQNLTLIPTLNPSGTLLLPTNVLAWKNYNYNLPFYKTNL